jgi:uncharacterized membrane protein
MIILRYISTGIGIAGVAVIVYGVLRMLVKFLRMEIVPGPKGRTSISREALRHHLGSYLLLGLELLIAADIILTITHPTLQDMAVLGSIVLIRTVISYFLDHEMADTHHLHRGPSR